MSTILRDWFAALELSIDVDCPDCQTSYRDQEVTWEVTRYEDGTVFVEQYFNCPGGAPAGSPHTTRGCGPTYVQFEFDSLGEQVV